MCIKLYSVKCSSLAITSWQQTIIAIAKRKKRNSIFQIPTWESISLCKQLKIIQFKFFFCFCFLPYLFIYFSWKRILFGSMSGHANLCKLLDSVTFCNVKDLRIFHFPNVKIIYFFRFYEAFSLKYLRCKVKQFTLDLFSLHYCKRAFNVVFGRWTRFYQIDYYVLHLHLHFHFIPFNRTNVFV